MKKLIFLLCLLVLKISGYAVTINPSYFDKQITSGDTGYMEYTIKSDSENRERYKIELQPVDKEAKDILEIDVYPKVVVLEPYASKIIKVLVKSKQTLNKPEYKFNLSFVPISIPTLSKPNLESDTVAFQGDLSIGVVAEVYGYRDVFEPKISVNGLQLKNDTLALEVKNEVGYSVKSYMIIEDNNGSRQIVNLSRISSGESQKVEVKLDNTKLKGRKKRIRIYTQDAERLLYEAEIN